MRVQISKSYSPQKANAESNLLDYVSLSTECTRHMLLLTEPETDNYYLA